MRYSWFSPVKALLLFGCSKTNWMFNIFVALVSDAMLYMIMQAHEDRVRDNEILHKQMNMEYNRFIYTMPPFRPKSTHAVGGDEPWNGK
ncbi:hypothetical protein BC829DRAFT_227093 [Chytridium lagenaria]|nr:hypothetical protein BC829DRAFT_227093 [Chytridium lagenaria]